jgi:hypothetical protein
MIFYNGSYYEGDWEEDKMTSKNVKHFDAVSQNIYVGPMIEGKK